jgi:hypothetical protein
VESGLSPRKDQGAESGGPVRRAHLLSLVPSSCTSPSGVAREALPTTSPAPLERRPAPPPLRSGALGTSGLGGVGPRRIYPAGRGLARLGAALASLRLRATLGGTRLRMFVPGTELLRRRALRRGDGGWDRGRVSRTRLISGAWNIAIALRGWNALRIRGLPALVHERQGAGNTHALLIGLLELLPENHPRIRRAAADGRGTVRRRGLPRGGYVVDPDPAHPRRRSMIGRDVPRIGSVPPTLGARILGRQRSRGSEHKDKQIANHHSSRTIRYRRAP